MEKGAKEDEEGEQLKSAQIRRNLWVFLSQPPSTSFPRVAADAAAADADAHALWVDILGNIRGR